jgi:hypothetical protein
MEVGKTYKTKNTPSYTYTCHGYDEVGNAVLTSVDDLNGKHRFAVLVQPESFSYYEKYNPPRKGTVWVNVYDGVSGLHSTRDSAERCAAVGRLACVEVPWVEGQGLEKTSACGCTAGTPYIGGDKGCPKCGCKVEKNHGLS